MSSPYLQIALECRPLRIDGLEATTAPPSLATLQLGLAMLFAGAPNIREVIAFPKTQTGSDAMAHAPSLPEPGQLDELYIASTYEPDDDE